MFDLSAAEAVCMHTEMIRKEAVQSYYLARSLGSAPRMTVGCRLLDCLGSLLIEAGIRLKTQAMGRPEPAASPTWLVTL